MALPEAVTGLTNAGGDYGETKKRNYQSEAEAKAQGIRNELRKLQAELCPMQEWVKLKGLRIIVVFEGRDAAGKGGTIKAITDRVSPRVFRRGGTSCSVGPREDPDVHAAIYAALPGRGRSRDLRSQLVQPGRRGIRDGLLHEG